MIESVSSSAACRPTLGSAPAPSPFVSLWPICSLTPALLKSSACTSVLATMNSTPHRPTSTIRLTALLPPPPTPTTLIFAPRRVSESSISRSFSSRPLGTSNSFMFPPGPAPSGRNRHESGHRRTPASEKLFEDSAQRAPHAHQCVRTAAFHRHAVPVRVQHQADGRRKHRAAHVIRKTAHANRHPAPDRQVENLFPDLGHPFQNRATAG